MSTHVSCIYHVTLWLLVGMRNSCHMVLRKAHGLAAREVFTLECWECRRGHTQVIPPESTHGPRWAHLCTGGWKAGGEGPASHTHVRVTSSLEAALGIRPVAFPEDLRERKVGTRHPQHIPTIRIYRKFTEPLKYPLLAVDGFIDVIFELVTGG